METNNQQILTRLTQHLIDFPHKRFGQALMDIGINEWANKLNPQSDSWKLRDIYNDANFEILKRMTQ